MASLWQKALTRALWVYHVNTGACNGCDIEVINVLTPYYDAERFGIKLATRTCCSFQGPSRARSPRQ